MHFNSQMHSLHSYRNAGEFILFTQKLFTLKLVIYKWSEQSKFKTEIRLRRIEAKEAAEPEGNGKYRISRIKQNLQVESIGCSCTHCGARQIRRTDCNGKDAANADAMVTGQEMNSSSAEFTRFTRSSGNSLNYGCALKCESACITTKLMKR